MVEAFSIRGLRRLADSWRKPAFAGDSAFSNAIREYPGNPIKQELNCPGNVPARISNWIVID